MAYGTDDLRCMNERYSYFIRGRKLVIIEWKNTAVINNCEPHYQAPTDGVDSLDGDNTGKSGIKDGILMQITAIPSLDEVLNEKDTIPLNDVLSMALVDYIKAQLVEDPKNQAKQLYYIQRFKDRIAKYNSRKVAGARIVLGNKFMR